MAPLQRRTILVSIAAIGSLALAGCAIPQESQPPADAPGEAELSITTPASMQWGAAPDSLPPGARAAILAGDPTRDGPFTLRLEAPAGYAIPLHAHSKVERVTIISGTGSLALGSQEDGAGAMQLPPGSYVEIPPGMQHSFLTQDEAVELQLHGDGPWDIRYVDAADDPREESAR